MNQKQFAKFLGVSANAVFKYIRDGKIKKGVKRKGGKYIIDPEVAVAELEKNLNPIWARKSVAAVKKKLKKKGKAKKKAAPKKKPAAKPKAKKKPGKAADPPADDAPSLTKHKTDEAESKAKLKRLEWEIKSGQAVMKVDVQDDIFRAVRVFRDGLMNVAPRVAAILAAESNEENVMKILHGEHKTLLNELIEDLKAVA